MKSMQLTVTSGNVDDMFDSLRMGVSTCKFPYSPIRWRWKFWTLSGFANGQSPPRMYLLCHTCIMVCGLWNREMYRTASFWYWLGRSQKGAGFENAEQGSWRIWWVHCLFWGQCHISCSVWSTGIFSPVPVHSNNNFKKIKTPAPGENNSHFGGQLY